MDIVKAATFEAVIQSSITSCDGRALCLEEVDFGDGEIFIGLGTKCETRMRWTNENYMTLTDEEHYSQAQNGTVPQESQKWVITSKSGCLKQGVLPSVDQEYTDGHRLAVDPACDTGHDSEFWAIVSPTHANDSLHSIDQPFTLVESHENRTRRLAYYANTTTPNYFNDVKQRNCTCVDFENDPLGALMVTQAHVHAFRPENEETYFWNRDSCDGHVLHVLILPPSPPPPSPDDDSGNAPPAPPYILWEQRVVSGAFASTGVFFFICCGFCTWCGLNGRVRGGGRNKWWGVNAMRIDRPPLGGSEDRGYFSTQAHHIAGSSVFLSSLPLATQRVRVDTTMEGLLERA